MYKSVVSLVFAFLLQKATCTTLEILDGKINGTILQTRTGTDFFAFRKIPFAQPPIGELRFKAPVPVVPWQHVLDCTNYGPVCWQTNRLPASEDCLHLNVFTRNLPSPTNSSDLKPVIVFIHGGGFLSGTPMDYGPEYLMDRDIVFVTINYRLGALGFLALETKDIPGNAALKDQSLALRWIQKNIRFFGGDPNRVTVAGISSGSHAITTHMVSPMSKGLFHNAIVTSGSASFKQTIKTNNFDLAEQVAARLNCLSNCPSQIAECLRTKSAADIAAASVFSWFLCAIRPWGPVIEPKFKNGSPRFLTDAPINLLKKGKFAKVNILTGTADEILGAAQRILADANATSYLNESFDEIAPVCFEFNRTKRHTEEEIARKILKFYFPFESIDVRARPNLHQVFADSTIGHPIHTLVRYTRNVTNVYYYKVTFVGRFSRVLYPRNLPYGVSHGDDLQYVFYPNIVGPNKILPSDPENFMVERMTRIWENFAATGNPNNPTDPYLGGMVWPLNDAETEFYLDIGNNLIEKNGKELKQMLFWDSIFV